jgi:hypothetical protein
MSFIGESQRNEYHPRTTACLAGQFARLRHNLQGRSPHAPTVSKTLHACCKRGFKFEHEDLNSNARI